MIKNRKVTVKHRILTGHVVLQAIPDAFGGVTIVPSCRFRKGEIREVSIRRETNGISFVLIDPRQATGGISLGGGILTDTCRIGLTKNGPGCLGSCSGASTGGPFGRPIPSVYRCRFFLNRAGPDWYYFYCACG